MKRLLRKVFYWDSPAHGAFFGLTLAGIGSWLLLSLFHFLWTLGLFGWIWLPMWDDVIAPSVVAFGAVAATMLLYSLFLIQRFYGVICCKSAYPFRKCSFLFLFAICLIAAGMIAGLRAVGTVFIVFFCWIFPLLLPKTGWRLWLAHALSWSLGLRISNILLNILGKTLSLFDKLGEEVVFPQSYYDPIIEFVQSSGISWPWFLVVGLLFLLLGYLLSARIWSRGVGMPYRQIFGRAVITLWFLLAINYLGQIFLAWRGEREAKQAVAALEQRFARPLTAQALGELYYNGEQPDPDFWEKETALYKNSEPFTDEFILLTNPPDVMPLEAMQQWRQHLQGKDSILSQWEQMFAGNILPMAQSYRPGNLMAMQLPHLSHIRQFNRLSRWRVRLALEDGDIEEALAASERQFNANNSLLRETNMIGALVWIACTGVWLDSYEMLLESRLLSDEQLLTLNKSLQTVEKQVPILHQRAFYSEAVFGLDCFAMLNTERGDVPGDKKLRGFRWYDFRYFVPQLWWYGALDKAKLARSYLVADFSEMPQSPIEDRRPLWISSMLVQALSRTGNRFHAETARLRAMQGLITAERYRRKHGRWPEEMESLPEDPFSGEPLRYRYGDCAIQLKVAEWDEESRKWNIDTQERTVPAVQVWSVGPDGIDDDGVFHRSEYDSEEKVKDDIKFIIRLE